MEHDEAKRTPEAAAGTELVQHIPISALHPFENHPFRVLDDESMAQTVESIRHMGIANPLIVRPDPDGGYEIISGHRRHHAAELAGLDAIPVIVRELDDDAAVIMMVDSNLQRESILPSEKAFAYKMKRDALNHQGITSPQVGEKLLTVEKIGADSGDSKNQVLRYIRLTYLIPELLEMVDENKIAFNPAVEISYLDQSEQRVLLNAMELNDCTPSHAQSIRLKKLSQEGVLQDQTIYDILAEQKPNQQEQYKFKREDIRKYFPKSYTDKQVCDTVIKLLEQWQRRRERDRDSR